MDYVIRNVTWYFIILSPIYKHFKEWSDKRDISTWVKEKTEAPKVSFVADAKKANIVYLVQKTDTAYADGSLFKYTKTDTLTLAQDWDNTIAKSKKEISIKAISSDTISGLTFDGKLKTALLKGDTSEGSDAVSLIFTKKSEKPEVKVEKVMDSKTFWMMVFFVFIQIIFVTMVYGPIAAFLVELFPTKIRYTSMSLPYHVGNGVFGGLVPFLGTLIVEYTKTDANPTGNPLAGLWYPIIVASICFVIGAIYLRNKIDENIMD